MSLNLSKSPLWATIVIVGLIGATALVAGYVDRPGTETEVAAADGKCASCPREGTPECRKAREAEACQKACCSADGACPSQAGCAAEAAKACSSDQATCMKEAGSPATCPKAAAAAAGGCGGAPCTRAQ